MNIAEYMIDPHPLTADFDIRLIKHRAGRITLRLTKFSQETGFHLGTVGSILDYATSAAGYIAIGNCFISECEISIHAQADGSQLVISVHILESHQQVAMFRCEIICCNKNPNVLLPSHTEPS